jgi:hypothetical protein
MDWAHIAAYVTGTVDQELLARNEYRATENRMAARGRISVCGSVLKFPLDACASSPPGPPALVRERQAVVAHHPVEQPRAPALATALLNLSKHYAAAGRHADATAAHAQSDAIRKKLFGPHGAGDGSFPIFSWSRQKSAMAAANVVKVVSGRSA